MTTQTDNRIRVTVTMNPKTWDTISKLSDDTMVPRSRLVEKAITEYLARRTQPPRTDARGEG